MSRLTRNFWSDEYSKLREDDTISNDSLSTDGSVSELGNASNGIPSFKFVYPENLFIIDYNMNMDDA